MSGCFNNSDPSLQLQQLKQWVSVKSEMIIWVSPINKATNHVLQYALQEGLGYSQQYNTKRTAHLVEVQTDEGITG